MSHPYLFTASFEHDSGLPEDRIVNTFHFHYPASLGPSVDADFENVRDMIRDFYLVDPEGAGGSGLDAVSYFMSGVVGTPLTIKAYRLDDPQPRQPRYTNDVVLGGGFVKPRLPSEVALCLSYKGIIGSGVNPARNRGRLYIGPLNTDALDDSTGRPSAAFRTSLAAAGGRLKAAAAASVSWEWIIWSAGARDNSVSTGRPGDAGYVRPEERPLLTPTLNAVTAGWVDNAFDTIRSRGERATTRTLF